MNFNEEQHKLDLRLLRIFGNAFQALHNNLEKDVAKHNLNPETFRILELLYNKGPHPLQKISEKFSIPSGSITFVVNKLVKQGLVERQPNPQDGRANDAVLTAQGKALFNEFFPKHMDTISQNFSHLSNEEKEQLIDLLKKMGMGSQKL
ncbi:MarR family winged helix-turn-helix transcriptional regulator [Paenibacillus sp. R14(2021)]|uniref:MarR family winged helix-turn-helix transcriptional regulator n=1 Tax=Paenibacillus sp. R14(2021) TaxID=2859228 RepID=UPI001C6163BA|nr:MarR family transcriptional regulator [Paenibacillus sp. R14(2021)]